MCSDYRRRVACKHKPQLARGLKPTHERRSCERAGRSHWWSHRLLVEQMILPEMRARHVPRLYRGIVFLTNLFFILAIVCLLATELRKLLSDSIKTTLYLRPRRRSVRAKYLGGIKPASTLMVRIACCGWNLSSSLKRSPPKRDDAVSKGAM